LLEDTPGIVVDLSKLKNTRIGDRALACLANTRRVELESAREEWGVDLLSDVRRIAFADEFVLMAGQVGSVQKAGIPANTSWERYGAQGKVFDSERAAPSGRPHAGLWGNELFVVSRDLDDIYDAIDIAEGWETEKGRFTHSNGVIYGTLEPGQLIRSLGLSEYLESVVPLLDKLVRSVDFELLVHQGVLVKTELVLYRKETRDILLIGLEGLRDILVRKSDAFGYFELSEIIDSVSVTWRSGSIFLEWEMPLGFVKQELSRCSF
jgi:hypothetical protein